MLSPATQDDAVLAAGMQAAEAEALSAAGTFGAVLRASPEFTALLASDRALSEDAEANAAPSRRSAASRPSSGRRS